MRRNWKHVLATVMAIVLMVPMRPVYAAEVTSGLLITEEVTSVMEEEENKSDEEKAESAAESEEETESSAESETANAEPADKESLEVEDEEDGLSDKDQTEFSEFEDHDSSEGEISEEITNDEKEQRDEISQEQYAVTDTEDETAQEMIIEENTAQEESKEVEVIEKEVEGDIQAEKTDLQIPSEAETTKIHTTEIKQKKIEREDKTEGSVVFFNTGKREIAVKNSTEETSDIEDFSAGTEFFEDDNSYTIQITEDNPYFPYEVQFKYGENASEVVNKWFMTPEDSVSVDGHTFYVSVPLDQDGNMIYTSLQLEIAGDTIIVYPREKTFTNPRASRLMAMSLQPLKEVYLSLGDELKEYSPIELTMVSPKLVFQGQEVNDSDTIIWTQLSDRKGLEYEISGMNDYLDLSVDADDFDWEFVVGKDNQLHRENTRYILSGWRSSVYHWLKPVSVKDGTTHEPEYYYYSDSSKNSRSLTMDFDGADVSDPNRADICLTVDTPHRYDHIEVFNGRYKTAAEASKGENITQDILSSGANDKGFSVNESADNEVTFVSYDASGEVTGCLPVKLNLYIYNDTNNQGYISYQDLRNENGKRVSYNKVRESKNSVNYHTYSLYKGNAASNIYYFRTIYYENGGTENNTAITDAFEGNYQSISAAKAAGAKSVREALISEKGYGRDYSKGVFLSIFIGEDGKDQRVYRLNIKAVEGTKEEGVYLSSSTNLSFSDLITEEGSTVPVYFVSNDLDSYGEGNYVTLLVKDELDLSKPLAPVFSTGTGAKVYTKGSSAPEESGKSFHDFSKGALQYTVSAEDGEHSANYWVQIVKAAEDSEYHIYIDSFDDPDSETKTDKNGVIQSKREIVLDGFHDYVHDILLTNIGIKPIPDIKVELNSNTLVLDRYWTLKGDEEISAFTSIEKTTTYGELANMAKIRLKQKNENDRGKNIDGTLTILTGSKKLAELKLSGILGDPMITTTEIPDAVLYVPYGTMIQNNNKYSYYQPRYNLVKGKLPNGMQLKANGELYGVPKETGKFTFTVQMRNSSSGYGSSSSRQELTLVVRENTDDNVDVYARQGYSEYDLTDEIPDMRMRDTQTSYLMRSLGEFSEYRYVFLDGELLNAGSDYSAEAGSTKLTIMAQTLKQNGTGRHTIGVEFRTKEDTFKRTSQNYYVTDSASSSGGSIGTSSSGGSGGGSSGGSSYKNNRITDNAGGTDTMDQAKAALSSGTAGMDNLPLSIGMTARINTPGNWENDTAGQKTAFNKTSEERMLSGTGGWIVSDHYWYYLDDNGQMMTGWRRLDNRWYYFSMLPDETYGRMMVGWQLINGRWYYFHMEDDPQMGRMYANEMTPDGYHTEADGSWKNAEG